jgi:chaperonin GroES
LQIVFWSSPTRPSRRPLLVCTSPATLRRSRIVAVGAGKVNDKGERIPMDVKVGDVVIYGKFGGNEVKVDGEKYLLMRADDIYAVVEA